MSDALATKNTCNSTPNKMTTSYLVCRPTESDSFLSLMSFWRFICNQKPGTEGRPQLTWVTSGAIATCSARDNHAQLHRYFYNHDSRLGPVSEEALHCDIKTN